MVPQVLCLERRGRQRVVVNYNAGDHLRRLRPQLAATGVDDIVVVDNGSSDGSIDAAARRRPAT